MADHARDQDVSRNRRHGVYPRGDEPVVYGFSTDDTADPVLGEFRAAETTYRRISGRPFRCTLTGVGRRDVHCELEVVEGDVWGELVNPADMMVVVLPVDTESTRALGAPLDRRAYLATPSFHMAGSSHGFTFATIDFRGEALAAVFAAAGVDPAAPPWARPAMIPLDGPEGATLAALLEDLADLLESDSVALAAPAVFARIENDFAGALQAVLAMQAPLREHDMTHGARVRLAWRAKDLLVAQARRPGDALAIEDVCRVLGTTERTLRQAFFEEFGVRFREMGRSFRLQAVHEELLAGDPSRTVTAIALRHGFWHLGRFAGHYREMFGRPPSDTWRGACGPSVTPPTIPTTLPTTPPRVATDGSAQ